MAFNSFTASTKIESAKMNQNFSAIADGTEVANVPFSSWTPTFGGFSANPNWTCYYTKIGKLVFCQIFSYGHGTSNAANFTFTLPVQALRSFSISTHTYDNGAWSTSFLGYAEGGAGSSIVTVYERQGGSWTSSGAKDALIPPFFYEVA